MTVDDWAQVCGWLEQKSNAYAELAQKGGVTQNLQQNLHPNMCCSCPDCDAGRPHGNTLEPNPPSWSKPFLTLDISGVIATAVLAERERCAKIADEIANDPHGSNPSCAAAEDIAAKIREGK